MATLSKFEHAIANPFDDLKKEVDRKFGIVEKLMRKNRWMSHKNTRKYNRRF